MEDIWQGKSRKPGRIDRLEDELKKLKLARLRTINEKEKKPLLYPSKWKRIFLKSIKQKERGKIVVEYYDKRGEIHSPMLLPIFSGNIIIYDDQAHRFDPSALWWRKIGNKYYRVLAIREIDRNPISNLDIDDIISKGDSTRNDKIFLKMLRLAMIEKVKKQINKSVFIILGLLAAAGVIIYFFFS